MGKTWWNSCVGTKLRPCLTKPNQPEDTEENKIQWESFGSTAGMDTPSVSDMVGWLRAEKHFLANTVCHSSINTTPINFFFNSCGLPQMLKLKKGKSHLWSADSAEKFHCHHHTFMSNTYSQKIENVHEPHAFTPLQQLRPRSHWDSASSWTAEIKVSSVPTNKLEGKKKSITFIDQLTMLYIPLSFPATATLQSHGVILNEITSPWFLSTEILYLMV